MSQSFSVTKVKAAFECPRLFYLGNRYGGQMVFNNPPEVSSLLVGIGRDFHKLCENCIGTLQKCEFDCLFGGGIPDKPELAKRMQKLLYEKVVFSYIKSIEESQKKKLASTVNLWHGLKSLINQWAELIIKNLVYCSPQKVVQRTFLSEEYNLKYTFTLPHGGTQLVQGKLDSLIFDLSLDRLCVIDYKTYHPADISSQLAQVALYSYMLKQKTGVSVDAAVYAIFPTFKEYFYPYDLLGEKVHTLIPHKLEQMQNWTQWSVGEFSPPPATASKNLCQLCPQKNNCQSHFDED
jgi:S-DNA-T family DNA segregation ATPase FtsK/SpoIIIE